MHMFKATWSSNFRGPKRGFDMCERYVHGVNAK